MAPKQRVLAVEPGPSADQPALDLERLLAHSRDDSLRLDPGWAPPEGVEIDPRGHPVVTVPGPVA